MALQRIEALSEDYDVFIDQTMVVGMPWARHSEAQSRQSDLIFVCISDHSVGSEIVFGEIEQALKKNVR